MASRLKLKTGRSKIVRLAAAQAAVIQGFLPERNDRSIAFSI